MVGKLQIKFNHSELNVNYLAEQLAFACTWVRLLVSFGFACKS